MRIARLRTAHGPRAAVLDGDAWDVLVADVPEPATGRDGRPALPASSGVRVRADDPGLDGALLAPCRPRVVVGMAHNSGPEGRALPPQAFLKSARTVVGPGAVVRHDRALGRLVAEAEAAVVVGRPCRDLRPDDVPGAILGCTVADDLTADDQVPLDAMMTRAKNGTGFTPLGPWIDTAATLDDAALVVAVDGVERARSTTAGLSYDVVDQLVFLTRHLELGPGDVVLTGAHRSAVPVEGGVEVALEVGGVGTLRHRVA
ncbi:2-keto-4-pentenoate hydratase/2-oxohepta-3-ene-1,7-dioic acid hydratase (catechol pathway) [Cellulosimicrobium aquatile]|uniref:2-keto-4-pentenoate hydratase/2-oxohepta-3-ene-1,7-dioic acid hydratase (Catechol pathway) n=2 Tax=Cellulosimicrobium TaxID=157920 RepID=A0A1N6Q478_9MICO|nr:fumarylacetoacetate hydrolase family protein [Cellulosimicrobium aquatile]SIQ11393.1 2-keto-4-pentenoate hydratase/2-oxohepta-3-ene-1,7-dioic acid hydratase (catechol pathway) [Cellulosimicrobium aquatile]